MGFRWLSCWVLIQQLVLNFPTAHTANILIFHNIASYSHLVQTWPLAEALAERGHNVTYITPYKYKEPNPKITEFFPVKLADFLVETIGREYDINLRVQNKAVHLLDMQLDFSFKACEALYSSPDFEQWLSLNPKFDLVIIDSCFDHECGVGLAYKLSAKFLFFSTTPTIAYEYDAFGYQPESSSVPEFDVGSPATPMGFLTRVSNALMSLRWRFWHVLYSWKMDEYIRTTLKVPEMPYIGDLISEAALVFYTGDVISDYPRALPPNHVNIAGIHCKDSTKPLPQDILTFIEGNKTRVEDNEGFVYISLGSLVVSSNLPDRIKQVFFQTIKAFPKVKFLWKWNGDFPKEIPENLLLRKWFPQMNLLAHQKIRGFVTQSGRPSCLEAVFNGVPLICFPVLGDQDFNANRLAEKGAAKKLEIGSVTLDEFKDAIKWTLYDPSLKERMNKIKQIFRDRPMSPVDTAVWWTEYVLRTEDTLHLRAAGANQNWIVRRQIDVWAFLSISLFLLAVGVVVGGRKIYRSCYRTQQKVKTN